MTQFEWIVLFFVKGRFYIFYIQETLVQLNWVKMANLTIFYMFLVNQEMWIHA